MPRIDRCALLCTLAGALACTHHRQDTESPRAGERLTELAPKPKAGASSGVLELLTYNVAGLPGLLSSSHPSINTAQVSPLLNHYHLVVAQEDFAYHGELVERAGHLYQVAPMPPFSNMFGDGLSTLSVYPLDDVSRVRWLGCNGYLNDASDCFGEKGFSVVRVTLSEGVSLDLYNLHAEAGRSAEDVATRRLGFEQLAQYILERGEARAVVVAGDTNLDVRDTRDRETLKAFQEQTSLVDIRPRNDQGLESLDRVLLRGSGSLELRPLTWRTDERFVDSAGEALSDHPAVAVSIAWNARANAVVH